MKTANKSLVTANAEQATGTTPAENVNSNLYNEQCEQSKAIWDSFANRFDGNDVDAVFNSIKTEADSGNADATYFVAQCYEDGNGVGQDKELSKQYYLKAANLGSTEAMIMFGAYLQEDRSDETKLREGYSWFEKAADMGLLEAKVQLGRCLLMGIGIKKDLAAGDKLMVEAAESGHPEGQYYMARKLEDSSDENEREQSLSWLKKSADNGYASAQVDYASSLLEDNRDLCCEYLKMAANQGDEEGTVLLGDFYLETEDRYEEGLGILYAMSFGGSVMAMDHLAIHLHYHIDQEEARRWAKKAVKLGSTNKLVIKIAK